MTFAISDAITRYFTEVSPGKYVSCSDTIIKNVYVYLYVWFWCWKSCHPVIFFRFKTFFYFVGWEGIYKLFRLSWWFL